MGGVEAVLQDGTLTDPYQQKFVYPLKYLNPFYGAMSEEFEKADKTNYYDVQKSYGMTFVPPDVGTKVVCFFIGNDSNQGYWIGCVQDLYQNHMIPGIAASSNIAWSDSAQKEKYGVDYLPVAEFHKKSTQYPYKPNEQLKPVHPFADRLLQQGLLADRIRGVTSSSARREFPSRVFGISTPGPIDPNSKKDKIGYTDTGRIEAPVSRFPGHTFVMDDGDTTGSNRLLRLRSGTGHQVLLNDSANVIYIANANGTAWMEFTANGKIDIYAADSVSIHSENDFNFRAGRDVNIEALRNVNIKAVNSLVINADKEYNLKAGLAKVYIDGDHNQYTTGNLNLTSNASVNLFSNENVKLTAKGKLETLTQGATNFTSQGQISITTQGALKISSSGRSFFGPPGNIASVAAPAIDAITDTTTLKTWNVPRVSVNAGWSKNQRYQDGTIPSIMQRVPMHEPWPHHESTAPSNFTPSKTDSSNSSTVPNTNTPAPPPNPNMPADWARDTEFLNKVKEVAKKYKMDYIDLLAVMMMESGIDPSATNRKGSRATGLIQFTLAALPAIGNPTLDQLRGMTRIQQMHYVDLYFAASTPGLASMSSVSLNDIYMAVFAPFRAFGKPDTTIIYSDLPAWLEKYSDVRAPGARLSKREFEALAYTQNAPLDNSKDRIITKAEACRLLPSKRAQVVRALGL
jgi:hypothetical protein